MSEPRWIKLDELQQPGMRLVIDARRQIEEETPSLIDKALTAPTKLAKPHDGGGAPQ